MAAEPPMSFIPTFNVVVFGNEGLKSLLAGALLDRRGLCLDNRLGRAWSQVNHGERRANWKKKIEKDAAAVDIFYFIRFFVRFSWCNVAH